MGDTCGQYGSQDFLGPLEGITAGEKGGQPDGLIHPGQGQGQEGGAEDEKEGRGGKHKGTDEKGEFSAFAVGQGAKIEAQENRCPKKNGGLEAQVELGAAQLRHIQGQDGQSHKKVYEYQEGC